MEPATNADPMSFLLLLAFQPQSMNVLCQSAWYHTFGGDTFYFAFYISIWCVFMSVDFPTGMGWFFVFAHDALAPFRCCALFCLSHIDTHTFLVNITPWFDNVQSTYNKTVPNLVTVLCKMGICHI